MAENIKNGMNPAEAAELMQTTMQELFDSLSAMGVDTSQLDWLMDHVNQLVSDANNNPINIPVNADGTQAINTTDVISNYIAETHPDMAIGADPADAVEISDATKEYIASTFVEIPVTADASAAYGTVQAFIYDASSGLYQFVGLVNIVLGQLAQAKAYAGGILGAVASSGFGAVVTPTYTPPPQIAAPAPPKLPTSVPRKAPSRSGGGGGGGGKAGKAAETAQDRAKKATEAANKALEEQQQLLDEIANAYRRIGTEIFKDVDAEAATYEALQKLGLALVENGKSFNTYTEGGRANFAALTDAFNAFGGVLSNQVERGVLSSADALKKFRSYAGGIYRELMRLGVPTDQIVGFFNAIGGYGAEWKDMSQDVRQFGQVLTDAAKNAEKAANGIGGITAELEQAKKWADALSASFDSVTTFVFGQQRAKDSALKAIWDMRDAYQDVLDKLRDLRQEQQKLNADLDSAQADKRKAEIEAGISERYGETDRAADYRAQAAEAQARIDDIKANIGDNQKEITSIEKYTGVLSGNSKEAIENRNSLFSLQQAMFDSITAYAAAGASAKEVQSYTAQLRKEFVNTATQSGYSSAAIASYTTAFDKYVAVVKSTPKTVTTTATANISAATAALNTIPKNGKYLTTATANTTAATQAIAKIPKTGSYVVSASNNATAYKNASTSLSNLAANRNSYINPIVSSSALATARSQINSLAATVSAGVGLIVTKKYMGGFVPGFASGGKIPGRPPANRTTDNKLASVNGRGLIAVRSGEFIQSQEAVDYYGSSFMNAVNNRTLPRDIARFASGGMPARSIGSSFSASFGAASTIVELSPADRALLEQLRDTQVVLRTNDRIIAESANRGNTQLNRRGNNG